MCFIVHFVERQQLQWQQIAFQRKAYAPNPILARKSQVKKYLEIVALFCPNYSPIPCDANQAVLYATWLARSFKYSSIMNYLSGLNYYLHQHGCEDLDYSDFVLECTLQGIKRTLGNALRQAIPILPSMLRSIFSFLRDSPGHNAWRAAILCCFRGLLRKSQVTQSDASLRQKDFQFCSWGLLINIRKCKMIQFRERSLMIHITRCPDRSLCAKGNEVAFRIPAEGGSAPLTYFLYQKMLKLFGGKAGYDPNLLSSHSLKRGGCTFLSLCGHL